MDKLSPRQRALAARASATPTRPPLRQRVRQATRGQSASTVARGDSGKPRVPWQVENKQPSQTWEGAYKQWAHWFALEAQKDKYSIFKRYHQALSLPGKPEDMLQATLLLVQACVIYGSGLDMQPYQSFLGLQAYDFEQAPDARYGLIFGMGRNRFGRLLTTSKLDYIDFADLYDCPWMSYKTAGFNRAWILRLDGEDFTESELARLETLITKDIRFDYTEKEVSISFGRMDEGIALLCACKPD